MGSILDEAMEARDLPIDWVTYQKSNFLTQDELKLMMCYINGTGEEKADFLGAHGSVRYASSSPPPHPSPVPLPLFLSLAFSFRSFSHAHARTPTHMHLLTPGLVPPTASRILPCYHYPYLSKLVSSFFCVLAARTAN